MVFSEDSRVKIPCILHLVRLGYRYVSLKDVVWEGKTSGIKNLLFDAFTTIYLVARPPQRLAKRFFDFVAPMEEMKQKLLQETERLAALLDWLLPLFMNGQVTVLNEQN